MVNPQENTKKFLNFFGTTYRCCASSAGTPALNILPACSAMSSKTSHTVAIPRCPQSCPCPGTNKVSLSHDAKVSSVARHPETVVFSSRHAGYHPLTSKSPVYTTFCSGTHTTMSVPECPGYDSITAVSPPSSTFFGSSEESSGRFGTVSTLAFASSNTVVNAFKSLCACARSTSDLA